MTLLPIVFRELRVAARRRATYWWRVVTALAAIGAGIVVYLLRHDDTPHNLARSLFETVSWGAFVYCLFIGVRSTADCVSEEKREGTLGLLFLTDLKGYDVVAGKLAATSLNSFYGLTAIFPVLAIPLLMGGVTNGEFWRVTLVLANTFFFSLAAGMLMSALCESGRKSMAGTLVLLLFFSLGLGIILLIPGIERHQTVYVACSVLNPGFSLPEAFDAPYAVDAEEFWWSVALINGIAWACLAAASLIVPRSWQDRAADAAATGWRASWRRLAYGSGMARRDFRSWLLDQNAFYWLAARNRLKPAYVWAALAAIAAIWAWITVEWQNDWPATFIFYGALFNFMLKFWAASEAGRRLGDDRKLGSLELILTTPLSVPDIIKGQFLALRRQFLGPLLAVMILEIALVTAAVRSNETDSATVAFYLCWWLCGTVLLVADLAAMTVVAMWVSLTARNPNRTTGITIARVLVLPWAIMTALFLGGTVLNFTIQVYEPGWKSYLAACYVPELAVALIFGILAWRSLQTQFRERAAHRYVKSGSWFSAWFRTGPQSATPPTPRPETV